MTKDAIRKPLAIQQNIFYTLISIQSNILRSVCNRLASLYPESDASPINSKNLASEEAAKDDPRLDLIIKNNIRDYVTKILETNIRESLGTRR